MNTNLLRMGCFALLVLSHSCGIRTAWGGDEPKKGAVAHVDKVFGALLQQTKNTWHVVKAGQDLADGALVVALPKAELTSKNGAIHLSMLADIGQRGPLPVLESAVVLKHSKDADLEVAFDRGLIILTNQKQSGAATVQLKVGGEAWRLTLNDPGSSVGMELLSRQSPGMPKGLDDKSKPEPPSIDVLLLVLKGRMFLDAGHEGLGLQWPPGLARAHWDNISNKFTVQRLEKLPENVIKPFDDHEAKLFKSICECTHNFGAKDFDADIEALLKSENDCDRLVGVTWAGAVDNLPRLLGALGDAKHASSRDHAVLVLRHWLGRSPDNMRTLYRTIVNEKKATDAQAKNVLHLLLGFTDEERSQPDTYQVLIQLLEHSALPVRELARWHLVRMAPIGRDIGYDAAASADERRASVARWRQVIPEGRLPEAPKSLENEKK